MAQKYQTVHEGNIEIRVLKRGKRHSVRVRMPADDNHPTRWWTPSQIVNGSKADAIIAGKQIEYSILHANEIAAAKEEERRRRITLTAFIETEWKPYRKRLSTRGTISKLTLDRERLELDRLKACSLGNMPLPDIDRHAIDCAYDEIGATGASPDAMHKSHMKLKQLMEHARTEGYIDINPCNQLKREETPKRKPVSSEKKATRRITIEQAVELADRLQSENPRTGFVVATFLALTTGMRRGECLGLTWQDVELKPDLSGGVIHVRQQYGKERERKNPKTEESERSIPIGAATARFLDDWRDMQQKQFADGVLHRVDGTKNKRGETRKPKAWSESAPVCSNDEGSPIYPDNLSRWRRNYFVECGLAHYEHEEEYIDAQGRKRIRRTGYRGPEFHSLRRLQATLLISHGEDPKTVQARLGHRDIMVTLSMYAEAVSENEIAAGRHVEAALGVDGSPTDAITRRAQIHRQRQQEYEQRMLDLIR